ncbi:MAG: hypothetical protein RL208_11 [Pseudomonadota bacterium]|jgi:prepilin-type N-terminal cleavage/methylation domain-containing protein
MKIKNAKSAFTLVELSVVLLVLSVLVAGLLVGKRIVDKATGRRMVQEADFYKKAVNLFQDSYGFLPGNFTSTMCGNITDFSSAGSVCSNWTSSTATQYPAMNYIASEDVKVKTYTMGWMKIAGLADAVPISQQGSIADLTALYTYENTKLAFAASNVSNDTYVTAVGFNLGSGTNSNRQFNGLRGIGGSAAGSENNEFTSTNTDSFYSLWNGRNGVVFGYNNGGNASAGRGVVSASIMKDIDVKYDDGKPLTGSIIALKPQSARFGSTVAAGTYCTTDTNASYGSASGTSITTSVRISTEYVTNSDYANDKGYGCNAVFQVESGAN